MAPLGQLAALGEDAVWERAPGATLADWAASPYSAEFAAETRTTERDQPVLWLAWSSEQARRVSRLMGWLHLVANGHATGRVMPLAPLVARVLQDASREQAVGLLWQFCSLFEGRALEPEAAHRLFNDGWLPLLRSAAPPRALVVYLARIAGTHNVRRRGVTGLGALQLEAPLLKRMQKLHDDHPSSEFMALTDKDAHALILALIASPEREAAAFTGPVEAEAAGFQIEQRLAAGALGGFHGLGHAVDEGEFEVQDFRHGGDVSLPVPQIESGGVADVAQFLHGHRRQARAGRRELS